MEKFKKHVILFQRFFMEKKIQIEHITPEEIALQNIELHHQNGNNIQPETLKDYFDTLDMNNAFAMLFCIEAVQIQSPDELNHIDLLLKENLCQHNFDKENFFENELHNAISEDAVCSEFNTDIIKEAIRLDLFPMSITVEFLDFLTIRQHKQKSIITWDKFRIPHKIPKLTEKFFKDYTMTFNKDFEGTVNNILKAYPSTWLTPGLIKAFTEIHYNPTKNISIDSVEIWDKEGNLVAGELGFITGSVYTSLTGYHSENHIGNVQLSALGLYLKENGFTYWDLGMYIEYKMRYGATLFGKDEQKKIYETINPNRIRLTEDSLKLTDFFNI